MDALYTITSPITGERLLSKVWTREEAFSGPHVSRAPDLLLMLRDGGIISILDADEPIKPRSVPVGCHRMEGVFMAKGPGIRKGSVLDDLSILDVAPLLLYTTDIAVPEDFEGKVPETLFEAGYLERRPITWGGRSAIRSADDKNAYQQLFDAKAEAEMAAHLRALGYIE